MHNSVIRSVPDPFIRALEELSMEDLALLIIALERVRKEKESGKDNTR